jgi:hypothetical protein
MPATYEPIASTTLGSAATNVEFTSIPGTYTDLVIVCLVQRTTTATNPSLTLQVNGDTGSNYSMTNLYGNGSSAASARQSSQTMINLSYLSMPSADSFAVHVAQVMSYANTSVFKTVLGQAGHATYGAQRTVGLWRSTSAITSVKVLNDAAANYAAGSTFSLYGIKAA